MNVRDEVTDSEKGTEAGIDEEADFCLIYLKVGLHIPMYCYTSSYT